MDKIFIIDFDSTFIRVEALDVLGEISLKDSKNKDHVLDNIRSLTDLGMNGDITFTESITTRLKLLGAHRNHLDELIGRLKKLVSYSMKRNKAFFNDFSDHIYIVSSGFRDFIVPVVADYGIPQDRVFANSFVYDADGNIVGLDAHNPLSGEQGKVKLLRGFDFEGKDVITIGDGYTDYETMEAGIAYRFYAFTENVIRDKVVKISDRIAPSLDEVLYQEDMPRSLSYPKSRIKVLLLEGIHKDAIRAFKKEGYTVETYAGAMDEAELMERIKDVSIIGIRSKTNITQKVLECANKLIGIGAFCIGTNQIDLEAARNKGVIVFNAPYSNTRSVVELALGNIILLMRNISDKNIAMHEGKWRKSAVNSYEIRGKKLGIIGYGNIGAQLSVLAESVGMDVYYYDVVDKLALGNSTKCETLSELLNKVDVVSIHVDGRSQNEYFFGHKEFDMMKHDSYFLNLSRGKVVDVDALAENIKSGKILGAALDVFPVEPKTKDAPFDTVLCGLPNTILTPHIGGSTSEAQKHIGNYVPDKFIKYVNTGNSYASVNFPEIQIPELKDGHRFIHFHENVPGILAQINTILSSQKCNVSGQYLKTLDEVGYVVTDIEKDYDSNIIDQLKAIKGTIRFRVLY